MRNAAVPDDIRGKCTALLQLYDSSNSEWQLGKTKVKPQGRSGHPVQLLEVLGPVSCARADGLFFVFFFYLGR